MKMKRQLALLTAAVMMTAALTGCSKPKTPRRSSGTDADSTPAVSAPDSQDSADSQAPQIGVHGIQENSLLGQFRRRMQTEPDISIISFSYYVPDDQIDSVLTKYYSESNNHFYGTENPEQMDDSEGIMVCSQEYGKRFRWCYSDDDSIGFYVSFDGESYYCWQDDIHVYGKGGEEIARAFEDEDDLGPDIRTGYRQHIPEWLYLDSEGASAWQVLVETGSMTYRGKQCRYEDYRFDAHALSNLEERLGDRGKYYSESDMTGLFRWVFDESGNLCGILPDTPNDFKLLGVDDDFQVFFSAPDDSNQYRAPSDYTECACYEGHLYRYYEEPLSWTDAEAACVSRGGHLASVADEEEQEFLLSLTQYEHAENIWIGGYYNNGDWEWTDDSSFYYTNWDMHVNGEGEEMWQPDNYTGDEYYLRYANKSIQYEYWYCNPGKWNDTANRADGASGDAPLSSFGYVCEWQLFQC